MVQTEWHSKESVGWNVTYIPRDVTLGANNLTFKVMDRVILEKKNNHHNIRNLQFGLEQSFQATKLYRPFV